MLNSLNILNKLKINDFTPVKSIQVFGPNYSLPLEWNYVDTKREFGAVIKNDIVLNILENELLIKCMLMRTCNAFRKYIKYFFERITHNTKCSLCI